MVCIRGRWWWASPTPGPGRAKCHGVRFSQGLPSLDFLRGVDALRVRLSCPTSPHPLHQRLRPVDLLLHVQRRPRLPRPQRRVPGRRRRIAGEYTRVRAWQRLRRLRAAIYIALAATTRTATAPSVRTATRGATTFAPTSAATSASASWATACLSASCEHHSLPRAAPRTA